MIRQLFGALSALVLAGALLGGCQSATQDPGPQTEVEDTPVLKPPEKPPEPETKQPPFNERGEVVHPVTRTPLSTTFYFEYDQSRLAQDDIGVLAVHAQILREYRNYSVQIDGHCDERGTREYNLALGERRWQAVRRYLISAGVRSTQIEGTSFGEERPVDPGHDESAWSKNRRAEMSYSR